MKISRALLTLTTIIGLSGPSLTSADDLFRLTFSGSARFLNENESVQASRLTASHLMARCVGTNELGTNHPYLLVYNATRDRIQVLNSTNGDIICDVLEFQNAYVNDSDRRSERLAFVFVPDQSNSVGSAVLYEKLQHPAGRISFSGRAQFALASLESASANLKFDDSESDSTATNSTVNPLAVLSTVPSGPAPISTVASTPSTGNLPSAPGVISAPNTTSTPNLTSTPNTSNPASPSVRSSIPLPPGPPTGSSSGTPTISTNVTTTPAPTNSVPPGQSPGTLLSATNNTSTVDTNVPGLPGSSPGTVLNTTNPPSTADTNGLTVPGVPGSSPGTVLNTTNNVSTNVVTVPGVTNIPSVPSTPSVPVVPSVPTPSPATNAIAETTSQVVSNIVICTGNFAAGRRVRVPDND